MPGLYFWCERKRQISAKNLQRRFGFYYNNRVLRIAVDAIFLVRFLTFLAIRRTFVNGHDTRDSITSPVLFSDRFGLVTGCYDLIRSQNSVTQLTLLGLMIKSLLVYSGTQDGLRF
ncbi:hypothetical protein QTP88_008863 [Uroleucon formosanum]